MRIATVNIGEGSYPAAFSLRVLCRLEDRMGASGFDALDAMIDRGKTSDTVWLLAQMLASGAKHESRTDAPTEDELLDALGIDDLHALTASVLASINTVRPTLETEAKKQPAKPRGALRALFG